MPLRLGLAGLLGIVALTFAGGSQSATSRDLIAFSVNERGQQAIFVVRSNGSALKQLTPWTRAEDPAWSPDGRRIIYSDSGPDPTQSTLRSVRIDGKGGRRFATVTGLDWGPAWSPSGRLIAFAGRQPPTGEGRDQPLAIWVMRSDGTRPRQLTFPGTGPVETDGDGDWDAAWSPDGKQIAFARHYTHDPNDYAIRYSAIYVVQADGSHLRRLSGDNAQDFEPAWSPNGKRIAFVSTRDHNGETSFEEPNLNGELYVMNADGSGQRRLTNNTADDRSPTWSPDSKRLAYSSGYPDQQGKGPWLYVMPSKGGNARRITTGPDWSREPAWKPR